MKSSRPKGVSRKISAKLCNETQLLDQFVEIIKNLCENFSNGNYDITSLRDFSKKGPFAEILLANIANIPHSYRMILTQIPTETFSEIADMSFLRVYNTDYGSVRKYLDEKFR